MTLKKLYVLNKENQLTIFNLDPCGDLLLNPKILRNREILLPNQDIFKNPKSIIFNKMSNFLCILNTSFVSILEQNQHGDILNIRTVINPLHSMLTSIPFSDKFYMAVKGDSLHITTTDNIDTLTNQQMIPYLNQ